MRENTDSRFFNWVIQRSSVVERSAVNRLVVGSNPTAGAILADLVIVVSKRIFDLIFVVYIEILATRGGAAW